MKGRRILAILLCLVIMAAFLPPRAQALSGAGTESNPYVIRTTADLAAMHDHLDAYFVLGASIDAGGCSLTPVGNETEGAFTGTLDGKGYTISNLTMALEEDKYVGLFGYLEGTVKDLKLDKVSFIGSRFVGGIAGEAGVGSKITGCSVLSGSVTSPGARISNNVGGIAGICEGEISGCTNYAQVHAILGVTCNSYAGGIAGRWETAETVLKNCINRGTVSVSIDAQTTYHAYAYAGGLIGYAAAGAALRDCTNEGSVCAINYAGGMVGGADGLFTAEACLNSGEICAENEHWNYSYSYAGGILGWAAANAVLTDCVNTSDVSAPAPGPSDMCFYYYSGGMIGKSDRHASLNGCRNSGTIYGDREFYNHPYYSYSTEKQFFYTGGMIGMTNTADLTECRNAGTVYGLKIWDYQDAVSPQVGGMIGSISVEASLVRCANSGRVEVLRRSGEVIVSPAFGNASRYTAAGCVNTGAAVAEDNNSINISSEATEYGKLSFTPKGILLRDADTVYCSDLRYPGCGVGYPLAQLQETESGAYAAWDMTEGWTMDGSLNSGLPMPQGYQAEYLSDSVLILCAGESKTLSAPFAVSRWEVGGDSSAVTVSGGRVTAVHAGTACITARAADGSSANCLVFVYQKRNAINLSMARMSLRVGESVCLTADLPAADPQGIVWSSSDEGVAVVAQDGTVTATGMGTAIVTAALPLSGVSASCTVTVSGKAIYQITLSDVSIYQGETAVIRRSIQPAEGYDDALVWTSSNESVAAVDETGRVTGISAGTSVITARYGSVTGSCTVTVKRAASGVYLDRTEMTLEAGYTALLTVSMIPEDSTDTIVWTTSNRNVATVNNGLITAQTQGTAVITAKASSGASASCVVKVVAKTVLPNAVRLSQTAQRLVIGEKVSLTATVDPANATDKTVTWESSDPTVAAVSSTGVVEALSAGTAYITATSCNGLYDVCQVTVTQVSSAAFAVEDSRGSLGETFETQVRLVKNPGISAFTLQVEYNSTVMTPLAVSAGELTAGGTLTSSADTAQQDGQLRVTYYSAQDMTGDGLLFTITWQAGGPAGNYTVSLVYDEADICNADKQEVRVSPGTGSILLMEGLVGDIYPDGAVDMKDIVYFARWFNGLEDLTAEQRLAADLLYDGSLDVKDLTALAQILSENLPAMGGKGLRGAGSKAGIPFCVAVSDAAVRTGEDVRMTVRGSDCTGVAAFRFRIDAPEGYTVREVIPDALLAGGSFAYNPVTRIVTWYSESDMLLNGTLFTIVLTGTEGAALPAEMNLAYSSADFFTVEGYVGVPLTALSGMLAEEYARFGSLSCDREKLFVEIDTNLSDDAILTAAFYRNGRMTDIRVLNITLGEDRYPMELPADAAGMQCKVFLVKNTSFVPLAESSNVTIP